LRLADRLVDFLFDQPADSLLPDDIRIRPDIDGFASLDFARAAHGRLVDVGRAAADSVLGIAECLPGDGQRLPRSGLPHVVGRVQVMDAAPGEELLLARALGLGPGDSLEPEALLRAVRRAEQFDGYRAIWLGPTGAGDSVDFTIQVRRAPDRQAALGVAYDADLGGRLWLGIVDRQALGLPVEASAALLLGELRRDLSLAVRGGVGAFGAHRLLPATRVR